jgi:hypothetical protein
MIISFRPMKIFWVSIKWNVFRKRLSVSEIDCIMYILRQDTATNLTCRENCLIWFLISEIVYKENRYQFNNVLGFFFEIVACHVLVLDFYCDFKHPFLYTINETLVEYRFEELLAVFNEVESYVFWNVFRDAVGLPLMHWWSTRQCT